MFRLLRCQELSRWPGHSSHFLLHTNVLSSNPFVHLSRISCSTVSLIGSGKFSHFAPCPRFFFSSNCWFIFTDPLIFFFCIQLEFRFIFLLLRCAFLLRILICPRAHIWSARVCPVFFCIDFLRNQFPPIFYEKSYIFFGAFEIHATCTQIGGQAAGFKTVSVDQNKKWKSADGRRTGASGAGGC